MRQLSTAEMSLVSGGNGYSNIWQQVQNSIDRAMNWGEFAAGVHNAAARCLLRDIRLSLASGGTTRSDCGQVGIDFYYEIDWSDYGSPGDDASQVLTNFYNEEIAGGD